MIAGNDTERKSERFAACLIVLLGLVLRLIHAGGRSLRFEEELIAQIVSQDLAGVIKGSTENSTPIIFNLMVHYLVVLFGNSEFILSLVSVISGTLLIWVAYLFGKRYFSHQVALLAAFLTAISPYLIYYSQEVRPYALLTLFTFASAYFFMRALETNKISLWAATILFNILAVYTQPLAWLIVVAECIYFVVFLGRYRRSLWAWLVSTLLVGLYYLPQHQFNKNVAMSMKWQFKPEVSPLNVIEFIQYTLHRFFGTIMHFTGGYYYLNLSPGEIFGILKHPFQGFVFISMAGLPALLLIFGLLRMLKEKKALYLYISLLFLIPVAVFWMEGTFPRYFVTGTVPFMFIAALGFFHMPRTLRYVAAAFLLLTATIALVDIYTSPASTFSAENPRDLSKYIEERKSPGDAVLFVGTMNGGHTWRYYNKDSGTIFANPFSTAHDFTIRRSMQPQIYLTPPAFHRMVDPYLERSNRIWLVMQTGKHDLVRGMMDALRSDYDIDLLYNEDEMNLAEIKRKQG